MNVHIVGAGAIGGLLGAHLHRAGHRVTLVDANEAHVRAINERGLRIVGKEEFTVEVPAITPEQFEGDLGVVLLAVKSVHTSDAMSFVAPRLAQDGYVVSLQNGLEEYEIAESIGRERTIGALVTFGGFYEEPGTIRFVGTGTLSLGEIDGSITPRIGALAEALSTAHEVEVTDNIMGHLWSKTVIAAPYFATALADRDVPELFQDPSRLPVFSELAAEVADVAAAEGVEVVAVDGFDPSAFTERGFSREGMRRSWDAQIDYWLSNTQYRTGVWRDLAVHHRKTEVDRILTPVRDRARVRHIEVPVLSALIDAVHEAELGRRALGTEVLDELEAVGRDRIGRFS